MRPSRTATLILWTALAGAPAPGQDPVPPEIARALREAKREHDTVRARVEKEAADLAGRTAEETKALVAIREEEKSLLLKLRSLEAESRSAEEKLAAASRAAAGAAAALKAIEAELQALAAAFSARLDGSLLAAEDPRLGEAAAAARKDSDPLGERVAGLLDAYEKVLGYAQAAAVLQLPVALEEEGGKIEKLLVLRLGLLGGYYARPAKKGGGLVFADSGGRGGFVGRSRGLSGLEREALVAIVQRPEKGGLLPIDVTAGAGLAAAQAGSGPRLWLEEGGPFIWALIAVAALCALLAAERALVLGARSVGLGKKLAAVLALLRSERLEAAETACARMAGPAGGVLGAAIGNRDLPREALESAVEASLLRHAGGLRARLGLISLGAALAVLIGVLGFGSGLASTFRALSAAGASDPALIAGGLARALSAVEASLWVAIPCVLVRGVLGAIADRAAGKIEAGALEAVAALLELQDSPLGVGGTA